MCVNTNSRFSWPWESNNFFWSCYSYGPQQGPDRQQKEEEGSSRKGGREGCSRKKLEKGRNQAEKGLKEGSEKREPRQCRVEGAQVKEAERKSQEGDTEQGAEGGTEQMQKQEWQAQKHSKERLTRPKIPN